MMKMKIHLQLIIIMINYRLRIAGMPVVPGSRSKKVSQSSPVQYPYVLFSKIQTLTVEKKKNTMMS